MTWFDVVAMMLILLIAWLESVRGFGRAIIDFAGGLVAVKITPVIAMPLAKSIPIIGAEGPNHAFWFATIFIVLATLTVVASWLIYQSTLLSLEYLDPIFGAVLGIGSGVILAFVFLRMLQLDYGTSQQATALVNSFAGEELLQFQAYHRALEAMMNLGK
jgi:uncharacterized membrane protein required for colicin V production